MAPGIVGIVLDQLQPRRRQGFLQLLRRDPIGIALTLRVDRKAVPLPPNARPDLRGNSLRHQPASPRQFRGRLVR